MNINVYGMSSTSLGLNFRSPLRTCFKILTFTAATTSTTEVFSTENTRKIFLVLLLENNVDVDHFRSLTAANKTSPIH